MIQKTVYINYYDKIDLNRVKVIMAICSEIVAKENPDVLYFFFASQGGQVDAGIVLYNFLQSLPVKIVMHNTGSIDSIANVIFMAGEERIASPHSTFLFHGVTMEFGGPIALSLPQLKEMTDRIKKNHATIAGIICENTKMSQDEIEKLFLEGETKDVVFATEKGIINKVELPQIPKDATFVSINING